MVTWRAALLFGLAMLGGVAGAVAVPGWPNPWLVAALSLAGVTVLSMMDYALAGAPGEVRLARAGETQTRLGESATVTLSVTNGSVRPLRGEVRDAWVPSAGATGYAHEVSLDPGETVELAAELTPTRRGDRRAVRVTVRSYGPAGLAFRQTSHRRADALTPPWTVTVLPRFDSRKHLPEKLSRLRVI
ncbi:MAG TPA: DUF58 domain-containing protein, partial [Micromonosporaceae bacterium]|nr:DUF58 domain-containing protein [Micromonosporaceae bacterium]